MSNAAAIARFVIEEHKPMFVGELTAMTDEVVGLSIDAAVSKRFPGCDPDDFLQGLLVGQEIELPTSAVNGGGLA